MDEMARLLPSISSLRAFEASARHLSFSKAADELNITQGAVSRQIKTLEDVLGLKLFYRVRKRIVLSEPGAAYAERVRACLSQIEAATLDVLANGNAPGVLNLAVLSIFGTKWLRAHLPEFWQSHPEVTVNVRKPSLPFDFTNPHYDAAILFGDLSCPRGFVSERLMSEQLVVTCAPSLTKGLTAISELAGQTLLHDAELPHAWQDWLKAAGMPHVGALKGPRFDRLSLVLTAAVGMRGIALLPHFCVTHAVESGLLVVRFKDISLPQKCGSYHLVYREEKKELPSLRVFRDWLLPATARQD